MGIVEIKQDLHDAAEEFDSQQAFHNGTVNLGVVINASIHGLQESVDNFGVFDALDDMVQTVVGGVPEKINSLIMPIGDEEEVDQEAEEEVEEERPEIRDNLVVETHENFEPIEPKFFDNMFDMGSPVEEEVEEVKEVKDEFIADEIRDVDPRFFNLKRNWLLFRTLKFMLNHSWLMRSLNDLISKKKKMNTKLYQEVLLENQIKNCKQSKK